MSADKPDQKESGSPMRENGGARPKVKAGPMDADFGDERAEAAAAQSASARDDPRSVWREKKEEGFLFRTEALGLKVRCTYSSVRGLVLTYDIFKYR